MKEFILILLLFSLGFGIHSCTGLNCEESADVDVITSCVDAGCQTRLNAPNLQYLYGDSVLLTVEGEYGCDDGNNTFYYLKVFIENWSGSKYDSTIWINLSSNERYGFRRTFWLDFLTPRQYNIHCNVFNSDSAYLDDENIILNISAETNIKWYSPNENETFLQGDSLDYFLVIEDYADFSATLEVQGPLFNQVFESEQEEGGLSILFKNKLDTKTWPIGDYKIIIETENSLGLAKSMSRDFSILGNGFGPFSQRNNPPHHMWYASHFSYADMTYVVGGGDIGEDTRDEVWAFDEMNDTWIAKNPFPGGDRREGIAFVIGEYAYVGGGRSSQNATTYEQDFWRYDPANDLWTQLNDLPALRTGAVGFAIDTLGYMGTGWSAPNSFKSEFWSYDPDTDSWSAIAFFPGGPRIFANAIVWDAKAYVGLGKKEIGSFNDWWSYDPAVNSWTRLADFPGEDRFVTISFVAKDRIFTGFGIGGVQNYIYEYVPGSDNWLQKSACTNQGPGFAFSTINGAYIKTADVSQNFFFLYDPDLDP